MKLIILKQNLKDALSAVERGVIENNNLPILKNVLIKADTRVSLSTTNLEIGVRCTTAGKITENGSITVPFHPLYNIVSVSDSERIALTTEKNNLIVKTDNYEAKIQGIDENEFPIIPKVENAEHGIMIDASELKRALSEVVSSAQTNEIKPELSGVLFDFQVTMLKLVATDSFRLAEKTLFNTNFKTTIERGLRAIVPLRTIQEVLRIFSDDQKLKIAFDTNQVLFESENISLISRLIDGQYPDYQAIIPKNSETEIIAERTNLITALKLVSNFSGRTSDVKFKATADAKALEVYSNNQYLGENNYLIPIKKKGEGFEAVSFNWRYLLDALRPIEAKQIMIGINGDTKPAVIKPLDDETLLYIVMPAKSA